MCPFYKNRILLLPTSKFIVLWMNNFGQPIWHAWTLTVSSSNIIGWESLLLVENSYLAIRLMKKLNATPSWLWIKYISLCYIDHTIPNYMDTIAIDWNRNNITTSSQRPICNWVYSLARIVVFLKLLVFFFAPCERNNKHRWVKDTYCIFTEVFHNFLFCFWDGHRWGLLPLRAISIFFKNLYYILTYYSTCLSLHLPRMDRYLDALCKLLSYVIPSWRD